jgi:hypothetical protein
VWWVGGLVLATPIVGLFPVSGVRQAFVETPYTLLISLWFLCGLVMAGALVTAVYIWRTFRGTEDEQQPSVFSALGIICLQLMIWTAVVGYGNYAIALGGFCSDRD